MPTASREVIVTNERGFHARPAMAFADVANRYESKVTLTKPTRGEDEGGEADGKSVMQLIILAAVPGTPMRIDADGPDAEEVVAKLAELFERKFDEE